MLVCLFLDEDVLYMPDILLVEYLPLYEHGDELFEVSLAQHLVYAPAYGCGLFLEFGSLAEQTEFHCYEDMLKGLGLQIEYVLPGKRKHMEESLEGELRHLGVFVLAGLRQRYDERLLQALRYGTLIGLLRLSLDDLAISLRLQGQLRNNCLNDDII